MKEAIAPLKQALSSAAIWEAVETQYKEVWNKDDISYRVHRYLKSQMRLFD